MSRIFGFDVGTTSIGWVVLTETSTLTNIVAMGVRIFPEARDVDGTPLNQTRRAKRMARRQLRRRKQRRRDLRERLAELELLPRFQSEAWTQLMKTEPLDLRNSGTDKLIPVPIDGAESTDWQTSPAAELSRYEVGRALYHLAKRRHFKGRDAAETDGVKDGEASDSKAVAAADARKTFSAHLSNAKRTIAQELVLRDAHSRKRGVHAQRSDVLAEFDNLVTAQARFHTILNEPGIVDDLREAVFYQRPVFWRKSTLGHCRLMPGEPLAAKASWVSCQRRMLEMLNNLRLEGGNGRPLLPDERAALLDRLQTAQSMTWGGVRKCLEPLFKARGESTRSVKFNLEVREDDDKLIGNVIEARIAAAIGEGWSSRPDRLAILSRMPEAIWHATYGEQGQRVVILQEQERRENRARLIQQFADDFRLDKQRATALADVTLPTGWDAFSTAAIETLLPELEAGTRMGTLLASPDWQAWHRANFPDLHQPTGEILDRLPSPKDPDEQRRLASLRNPTVIRVQNELRKVVNNLIGAYGKPDLIRFEMTRDIGLSKRERKEKQNAANTLERVRKRARADLEENNIPDPSEADIEKWLLWTECDRRDPYSGDHIGFDDLFRLNRFQVEHIWPRSRVLDDSRRNKTLCRTDLNLEKGNRTPYEAFGHDTERWGAICARLADMRGGKGKVGMADGKIRRFMATAILDDFASRQLNDTGWAARAARESLVRLWPDLGPTGPVTVQPVNGRVTGHLRRLWGLNHILGDTGEKNRADHRHHAIDALVVACCDPGVTQRLSRFWQLKDENVPGGDIAPPWPTIRDDATRAVDRIVVSHRVRKKVSGPLHDEKYYGDTKRLAVKFKADNETKARDHLMTQAKYDDLISALKASGKKRVAIPTAFHVLVRRKAIGDLKKFRMTRTILRPLSIQRSAKFWLIF